MRVAIDAGLGKLSVGGGVWWAELGVYMHQPCVIQTFTTAAPFVRCAGSKFSFHPAMLGSAFGSNMRPEGMLSWPMLCMSSSTSSHPPAVTLPQW